MTGHHGTTQRRPSGHAEMLQRLDVGLWAVVGRDGDADGSFGLVPAPGPAGAPAGAMAWSPPLAAESLGAPGFRRAHSLRYAYIAGDMAGGISSPELVAAMALEGMLGFYGAGGVELAQVEEAIDDIRRRLPGGQSFGANLLHSPLLPDREWEAARLYVRKGVRCVSASGYARLTPPVVYYRLKGLRRGRDGSVEARHHVFAKVSRPEVAREFLEPAPDSLVNGLLRSGDVTAEEAKLAASVPVADHITAEGDSAGHTDKQATVPLLSSLCALRRRVVAERGYAQPPWVGCAGGIGTPTAVAAAFIAGADYVLTGSINQACREAATSDTAKRMLAAVDGGGGVAMAPAGDMFEIGARVQVLKTRTLFAARAGKLYDLYNRYNAIDAIPAAERASLEQRVFGMKLDDVWREIEEYLAPRYPEQLERGRRDPHFRMGLVFRWYLLMSSRWARDGDPNRTADYQIWCGPAMAAFNQWAAGSFLEPLENRRVAEVGRNLMEGAALLLRARFLALQGLELAPDIFDPRPRRFSSQEATR